MIKDLREKGMSISEISRQLGIDRKTVRRRVESERVPKPFTRKRRSKLDPVKPIIRELIDRYNLSAVRILEEIRKWGYKGSYTILKDYCRTLRKERSIKAVYRFETEPGKQAQVDLGHFGYIDMDGKPGKLYAFSYVLGYSRYKYVEFTTDISTQSLIKLHMNAFLYTGGVTKEILYDNMKQVVLNRKLKARESRFNSLLLQFADHYGFLVTLCYPNRPQTKGKVENSIKFIRNNFFNGRTFHPLEDINNQCSQWLKNVNSRVHGTTGRVPGDMLKEENLSPITGVPEFRYSITHERKVSRDCLISYNGNRYSVHWKHAGRIATVREENGLIHITIGDEEYVHDILPGTGRISRKEEHFDGLLASIRERNMHNFIVEKRDLKEYEVF